jgi:hypothetical protein
MFNKRAGNAVNTGCDAKDLIPSQSALSGQIRLILWGYIKGVDGSIARGYPLIYGMLKVYLNAYIRLRTKVTA